MNANKWYSLLIKEPYFSYICSDEFDVDSQLFRDYCVNVISAINYGYTIAAMDPAKQSAALESLNHRLEYAVARDFLHLCDFRPVEYPKCCISNHYDNMSAEELGVNIMHSFWSRMGGSFENDFAKSGRLKQCLTLLKSRIDESF